MGTRDLKVLVVIMLANGDREYVQYYVHYHDIHWNPDIPDILWQYLYNILAWCNYESWSSCRPCRYITSKQAWIEWCCTLGTSFTKNQQPTSNQWCCYLPRREAQRRLDLVLSQRSIRPRDWHWFDSWQKALKLQQVTFTKASSDSRPFNKTKPPNPKIASHFHHGFPPMFLRMDLWGEDFEILYKRLETEGKGRKTVKAQHLWFLCHQKIWGTWYMEIIDWCIVFLFETGRTQGSNCLCVKEVVLVSRTFRIERRPEFDVAVRFVCCPAPWHLKSLEWSKHLQTLLTRSAMGHGGPCLHRFMFFLQVVIQTFEWSSNINHSNASDFFDFDDYGDISSGHLFIAIGLPRFISWGFVFWKRKWRREPRTCCTRQVFQTAFLLLLKNGMEVTWGDMFSYVLKGFICRWIDWIPGSCQSQIQPAELGHHPLLQLM